jgi:PadR family transcriptional regulator PadR
MENESGLYRRELLKGSTETLLLSLLAEEAMYGYQLVREMERRSSGYFRFKEGTLYPALHRLEKDKLVVSSWGSSPSGQNRKYYHITEQGKAQLDSMIQEWNRFAAAVNLVAQPRLQPS